MYEIRSLDHTCCFELLELWNKNFSEEFKTTESMLKNKIFEDKDIFKEGSFMLFHNGKLKGIIVAKIDNSGLEDYINCGWINSFLIEEELRHKGWGNKLLCKTEAAFLQYGIKKIILGGDFNNFFSGIPNPDEKNIAFFENRKYHINDENHYDLMADLSQVDIEGLNVHRNTADEYVTVPVTAATVGALEAFFDKAFPGRWKLEVMSYVKNGGDLRHIHILCHNERVIGFSKVWISDNNEEDVYLYGRNRGSLGPIGISEQYRGKGLGNRLLNDSLLLLKASGAQNVLIDWTILKDFYGQFGFTPYRSYRGAYKQFEAYNEMTTTRRD